MADVELLPLPEPLLVRGDIGGLHTGLECQHYARANVEHHTAPLQAENERLRAEVAEWKRVAAAQAELHGEAEARAERLAEALRWYAEQAQLCRKFGGEGDAARHALSADGGKRANRALAQEDRNG